MANSDNERRVNRGQKWREAFTAQWFNNVNDAVRNFKRNRGNTGGANGSSLIESNIQVFIQNNTDEVFEDLYRIVRIDESLYDVTSDPINPNSRPAFYGIVPESADDPIAILQDGVKNQEFYSGSGSNPLVDIVPGVIAGITLCKLKLNDENHLWANPVAGVTEYLESAETGQARILNYYPIEISGSSDIYWAFVNLIGFSIADVSDATHPDATPFVRGYVGVGPGVQTFGGPKTFAKPVIFNDKVECDVSLWVDESQRQVEGPLGAYSLPFHVGQFGYIDGPKAPMFGAGFKDTSGSMPFYHVGEYVVGYDGSDQAIRNGELDGSSNPQTVPIRAVKSGELAADCPFIPMSTTEDTGAAHMTPNGWVITNAITAFGYFITPRNYNNFTNGYVGDPPFVHHYATGDADDKIVLTWDIENVGKFEVGPFGEDDIDTNLLAIRLDTILGGPSFTLCYGTVDGKTGLVFNDGTPKSLMTQGDDIGTLDGGSF